MPASSLEETLRAPLIQAGLPPDAIDQILSAQLRGARDFLSQKICLLTAHENDEIAKASSQVWLLLFPKETK